MEFYKTEKSNLNFQDMPQIIYKWNIPILVDNNLNVILGNSLKDCLSDKVFLVIVDSFDREVLFDALKEIELKIAEENSKERIEMIYAEIYNFFKEVRKPKIETVSLFSYQEAEEITEETYVEPPAYDFNKHGKVKLQFNDGCVLSEEFIEKVVNGKEVDIEIDMEILKELL